MRHNYRKLTPEQLQKQQKLRMNTSRKRFAVLAMLGILGVLLIIMRLAWLQLYMGRSLSARALDQQTGVFERHYPRGSIVDRNGDELATSIIARSLYVDPKELQEDAEYAKGEGKGTKRDTVNLAAKLLAPALNIKESELQETFGLKGRFCWIKRTMDPKEGDKVAQIIKENKLPGLHFQQESKRYYTKNHIAAQVLGFVGTDDKGLSGLEMALNDVLQSKADRIEQVQDPLGEYMLEDDPIKAKLKELPTVYLTLDSKIQYVLEDAMDDAIARTKAQGAAAIIMDPYTGEILGMASRPTFNPNEFGKYPAINWSNKAVSMSYEPGSVFKPIVGCMGLTEGIITPNTIINDLGSIRIADRVIHNWDGEGMGAVPFSEVIKFSINTGMVQLGMQLGAERMISYAKKFGFGEPTGIELPGEESGILYNPKDMYQPDIATMAIGQGIAVTPLQELRAICAIANGGELLKPYIIKKIVAPDGTIIRNGEKTVVRNVITEQVAAQMREMMEKVVSEGGGKPAAIKGYRIAGKTGTAEKLAEGGGYAAGQYIASFVGFVPADKPQYAMLVILDNPRGAFYGSQVSAPIFRDTLQQILVAKGIQPSIKKGLPSFEEMDAMSNKMPKKARKVPKLDVLPNKKIKLADFKGVDMRTCADLLEKVNLKLKPYGSGEAYNQRPPAGTEVEPGSTVEVWFN